MDIIPPSKKYDKDTNNLLMFISNEIVNITRAQQEIAQRLQDLAAKKNLDVDYVTSINNKLSQLQRSAVVLHDIARRKISKY